MIETLQAIGNTIADDQNAESLLQLLRARSEVYRIAARLQVWQLVATVTLPLVGTFAGLWLPDCRGTITAVGLVLTALDVLWLDRAMKRRLKEAAKISEQFDCELLDMQWNGFIAGQRVDPEIVGRAANAWPKDDSKLRNWYGTDFGQVEHAEARVICQRSNLQYDSGLRRFYSKVLSSFLAFVAVVVGGVAYYRGLPWTDALTSIVLPLAPFIVWSIREVFRQRDAADGIDQVRAEADSFLGKVLAGSVTFEDYKLRSREFQDAIFLRRSQNPLIAPGIYFFKRQGMEKNMAVATSEIVRRLQQRRRPTSGVAHAPAQN